MTNILETGASLIQARDAYQEVHPLDHEDDVEAEHGTVAFVQEDQVENYHRTTQ